MMHLRSHFIISFGEFGVTSIFEQRRLASCTTDAATKNRQKKYTICRNMVTVVVLDSIEGKMRLWVTYTVQRAKSNVRTLTPDVIASKSTSALPGLSDIPYPFSDSFLCQNS